MKATVLLESIEPLNFSTSRSTSNPETLDYIPGSSVLGVFASVHIKKRENKDEFTNFFLNNKVLFGNLYPANFSSKGSTNPLDDEDELPVKPLPFTARSCKRFRGFRFNAKQEGQKRHGVTDHLIIWGLFALSEQKRGELIEQRRNCTFELKHGLCNESLDRFGGFYRQGKNRDELAKSRLKKRMLTRTGISRQTGTVPSGRLYNREVINEGHKFWGTFYFEDDKLFENFREFAKEVSCQKMLRLGNKRTSGLGLVKINKIIPKEGDTYEEFKERVRVFDTKFRNVATEVQVKLPHKFYFTVTLQSDVVIRDKFLQYRTRLDEDFLHETYNLENTELIYHSAGTRLVIGWNALWGLPEEYKPSISMGSVFLFGYNGCLDETFFEKLFEIQNNGIGSHLSRGFGEVTIADRFHWEVDEYGNESY